MKKAIIAAVAGLAIVGSGAVYAQHRHFERQSPRFSVQDRLAFVDARIAAVKAGLQLTPDQEKDWPPVETAVRDFAKQRIDRAEARRAEREARRVEREARRAERDQGDRSKPNDRKDFNPVARLQKRADDLAATAAGLKRIADSADPLYKSLDDAQKRRLAVLTHLKGRHGWGKGGFDEELGPPRGHRDGHEGPEGRSERL
ncbi:MAG: Spy/CpxP family protein refolding chaperone [Xanthobacteraceae bacterium]|nr:Spy/CpxP family protein refolding chaperone [Xanthobacteraceae bacterium]